MNRNEKYGRNRVLRYLFILCAIVGGGGLLLHWGGGILLPLWLQNARHILPDAASVGIIGGADGPTAIFVTTAVRPVYYDLIMAALLLLGLWGLWYGSKRIGEKSP